MIEKTCSICKNEYRGNDYFDLRKFFSPNKSTKDGLDTRCKECKRKMAEKYRKSFVGDKSYKENYKSTHEKRKIESGYVSNNPSHMTTEEIEKAILVMENRLKELNKELEIREKVKSIIV